MVTGYVDRVGVNHTHIPNVLKADRSVVVLLVSLTLHPRGCWLCWKMYLILSTPYDDTK